MARSDSWTLLTLITAGFQHSTLEIIDIIVCRQESTRLHLWLYCRYVSQTWSEIDYPTKSVDTYGEDTYWGWVVWTEWNFCERTGRNLIVERVLPRRDTFFRFFTQKSPCFNLEVPELWLLSTNSNNSSNGTRVMGVRLVRHRNPWPNFYGCKMSSNMMQKLTRKNWSTRVSDFKIHHEFSCIKG